VLRVFFVQQPAQRSPWKFPASQSQQQQQTEKINEAKRKRKNTRKEEVRQP